MEDQKIRRKGLLLVSILLILIVTLTPGNGKIAGNQLDKVAHFSIFFMLGISICHSFQKSEKLIEVMFLGILFGLFTEVLQQFIPGRNMDMYDGIADTLGIIVAYYVYRLKKAQIDMLL